jgi:hypothetical protein
MWRASAQIHNDLTSDSPPDQQGHFKAVIVDLTDPTIWVIDTSMANFGQLTVEYCHELDKILVPDPAWDQRLFGHRALPLTDMSKTVDGSPVGATSTITRCPRPHLGPRTRRQSCSDQVASLLTAMTVGTMESLSDVAAKQARRLARRPEMPTWTPILMGLLGVFFVVYLFVAIVTPAPKSAQSATATTQPSTTQPTTPTTTPTQPGGTKTVTNTSGQQVSVPTAALTVAQAAALGFYTTQLSSVPLATGSSFPSLSQAYPQAQLVSTTLVSSTPTSDVFKIVVNPGPPAAPGELSLNITVVDQSGQWAYASGG